MGYKTLDQNISFAEVALASSMENNRSLKMMEKVNQIINWSHVETLLMEHYQAGTSKEGADAYPPDRFELLFEGIKEQLIILYGSQRITHVASCIRPVKLISFFCKRCTSFR
jgi:hypothetical protein